MFAESDKKHIEKSAEKEQDTTVLRRKGPQIYKCRRFMQSIVPPNREFFWSDTEYVIFQVNLPFSILKPFEFNFIHLSNM